MEGDVDFHEVMRFLCRNKNVLFDFDDDAGAKCCTQMLPVQPYPGVRTVPDASAHSRCGISKIVLSPWVLCRA